MKLIHTLIAIIILGGCAAGPERIVPMGTAPPPSVDGISCQADAKNGYKVTGSRIRRTTGQMTSTPCRSYSSPESKEKIRRIFTPSIGGISQ